MIDKKYKVTMIASTHSATDYVPESILDAYVKEAKTKWLKVTVSNEPDYGPGGINGKTIIPAHLEV